MLTYLEACDQMGKGHGIYRASRPDLVHVSTKFHHFPNSPHFTTYYIRNGLLGPYFYQRGLNPVQLKEKRTMDSVALDWMVIEDLSRMTFDLMEHTNWGTSALVDSRAILELVLPEHITSYINHHLRKVQ